MLRADVENANSRIRRYAATSMLSVTGLLLSLLLANAATANTDTGSNDVFASAQILPAGALTVSGDLDPAGAPGDLIAQESGTLFPGGVVSHDFIVTPGGAFTAAIDNSASGTDTTLGSFDQSFNLIATDDDSSFLGTGLGSSLGLIGNPDGTIHLVVSGFSDFDFDGLSDGGGAHGQTGAYELLLFEGGGPGDVDLYAFTGLPVGQRFLAETSAGATGTSPDTVLGQFDNLGNLIQTNDDGGVALFSQLDVTVPASGTLFLGVSGFADFGFTGQHSATGSYALTLQPVPEPTGIVLLALALVATGLRRQR